MLTELCGYLRNYFVATRLNKVDPDKPETWVVEDDIHIGKFSISGGAIAPLGGGDLPFLNGQYIHIEGSVLNDGVYEYKDTGITELKDEVFNGCIAGLAIPKEVVQLSADIDAWNAKYGGVDGGAMSPYTSESFGGYSYSKSAGGASGAGGSGWSAVFASRLNQWRKI